MDPVTQKRRCRIMKPLGLVKRLSSGRVRLLLHSKGFVISSCIVAFIIALGIIGPFLRGSPTKTYENDLDPCPEFPLGTDRFGHDILAYLFAGIRSSLAIGFSAGAISLTIAMIVGGFASYKGRIIDDTFNVITNVFMNIPMIALLVIIAAAFETRSLLLVTLILGFTMWPGVARTIRSQVLSLKRRSFVELAKISGKSDLAILFTEIFPNMLSYLAVLFFYMMGAAISAEAGISMIGLGPTKAYTLGRMLREAIISQSIRQGLYWLYGPPGLVLIFYVGSLIMMGSTMDDILNPKLQRA